MGFIGNPLYSFPSYSPGRGVGLRAFPGGCRAEADRAESMQAFRDMETLRAW